MLRWLGEALASGQEESSVPPGAGAIHGPAAGAGPTATCAPSPPGKIRHLDALARAGVNVPAGFFLPLEQAWREPWPSARSAPLAERVEAAALELLKRGPVLVRSAMSFEDEDDFSGAGVGRSIRCGDASEVRAALEQQHDDAARTTALPHARDRASAWCFVQSCCSGDALGVVLAHHDLSKTDPSGPEGGLVAWIELHHLGEDALARGVDPVWAGPVEALGPPVGPALDSTLKASLVALTAANDGIPCFRHGAELEVVVADERVHVVQARPLPPARLAVRHAPRGELPSGLWRLDLEHNPQRLSAAHAWVVERLQDRRSPGLVVLDGWLYQRVSDPPRDWSAASKPRDDGPETSSRTQLIRAAVTSLLRETLPARLGAAAALLDAIATTEPAAWPSRRDEAVEHLRACIDAHVALAELRSPPSFGPRARLLTQAVLGVVRELLPTAWDLAAPLIASGHDAAPAMASAPEGATLELLSSQIPAALASLARRISRELHDLALEHRPPEDRYARARHDAASSALVAFDLATFDEADLRSALAELDDLLYAVGQLPLRGAWLRGAALAGMATRQVFDLDGDALAAVVRDATASTGATPWTVAAPTLTRVDTDEERPPAEVLWRGRAHPSPAPIRARFAVGSSVVGPLRRRVDLADLTRRPCTPNDIVALPSLLPQTALVLAEQGVRTVVATFGGASSHGARMAWELGLTALLGIGPRLDLDDGQLVTVDVEGGRLSPLKSNVLP